LFDLRSNTVEATVPHAPWRIGQGLSVETEKLVQANRDKAMQQELDRYMRHAVSPLARRTGPVYAPTRHR
jgi:hypothetical protein